MIVSKKYNIHYFKDNNIRRWVAVAYIIYLVVYMQVHFSNSQRNVLKTKLHTHYVWFFPLDTPVQCKREYRLWFI